MGWLQEHAALKVTSIRARSEGPFDEAPASKELHTHEQNEWRLWRQQLDEVRREIIEQGVHELSARSHTRRRPGRPGALASYKNYKSRFLREWAQFITQSAKQKAGLNQHDLAAAFGYTEANQWRDLKRGAQECYRMTHERFVVHTKETVIRRGWNTLRRGNLVFLWNRHLMNPPQFEELIGEQELPQICVTEDAKLC